jgi:hypothetical protein
MPKQAEKSVLATLPMDNLLSYKYQKGLQASKTIEQDSGKNQDKHPSLLNKRLISACLS